jgi:hypothetical protein
VDKLLPILISVTVLALLSAAAVLVKQRLFPQGAGKGVSVDVADYIAMMVGVLYALILGLALVSVWELHDSAKADVVAEAGALHETYRLADVYDPPQRDRVHATALAYADEVAHDEWPRMADGDPTGQNGWRLLARLQSESQLGEGANSAQQVMSQQINAELSATADARRAREADAGTGLSGMLWLGLVIGGVLTVAFVFLFGAERSGTHLVMVAGLTALIAFVALLIYSLSTPFSGAFGTGPAAFLRDFPAG